ncbi:MAG TPA: hypothetical protein VII55_00050, partial [Candidatus Saccharimonadales bacterium]
SPTSNGSGTLLATVTDSVLYTGSASQAMSYTSSNPITITGYTKSGPNESITWTGGNGTSYTGYLNGNATSCQTSGNSCNVPGVTPGDTIIVKDSDGNASSPITVSGP